MKIINKSELVRKQILSSDVGKGLKHKFIEFYEHFDDVENKIDLNHAECRHIFFYNEIVKKIRASEILFYEGFVYEGMSLLRTVYEINNILLSLREKTINYEETSMILAEITRLNTEQDSRDDYKNRQKPIKNAINKTLKSKTPKDKIEIAKVFEEMLNSILHNSSFSYSLSIENFLKNENFDELFSPTNREHDKNIFIDFIIMHIFMTLKNYSSEKFVLVKNNKMLNELVQEFCYKKDLPNQGKIYESMNWINETY